MPDDLSHYTRRTAIGTEQLLGVSALTVRLRTRIKRKLGRTGAGDAADGAQNRRAVTTTKA